MSFFTTILYRSHPLLPKDKEPLFTYHPLFTNQNPVTQKESPAIPLCLEAINNIISFLRSPDIAQMAKSSRTLYNLTRDALTRKIDPASRLPRTTINKVLGFLETPAIPLCSEAINNIISFLGLHDKAQVARSSRTWHNLTRDALTRKIDPASRLPRNAINKVLQFLEPPIRALTPTFSRSWNALTRKYIQGPSASILPEDMLNNVLSFLGDSSRALIATSSRGLYDLVRENDLYEISLISEHMLKALMHRFSINLKNILDNIDKIKGLLSNNQIDQKSLDQLNVLGTQTTAIYEYIISSKPINDNFINDLKKFYMTITQSAFYIDKTLDQLEKNASPETINDLSETLSSLLENLGSSSNELYIRLTTDFYNFQKNYSRYDYHEKKSAISVLLKHLPTDFFEDLPRNIKSIEVFIDGLRVHETFISTINGSNNHKRSTSLKISCQELLKMKALNKSIEQASLITIPRLRHLILIDIAIELLKTDKNAAIALFLAQGPTSNSLVINFCFELAHNGNFIDTLGVIDATQQNQDSAKEITLQVLTKLLDFDIKDFPRDEIVFGFLKNIQFESIGQKQKFISRLSKKIESKMTEHITPKDPRRIIYLSLLCELDRL